MQNTVFTLRRSLAGILDSHGHTLYDERECRAIADLLVEEVCGLSRADRILHPELEPTAEQSSRLHDVMERMSEGMPVQQALGYVWFCGERFEITPDVLVPRPETAELVEWIVADTSCGNASESNAASSLSLCDIGTGSGCIALSLARLLPQAEVVALDVSSSALDVARSNARRLGVSERVRFVQADILEPVASLDAKTFDVIVSNPPYVCRREASDMSDLVLDHEPHLALFVSDDNPLCFYRAIAQFGLTHLVPGGRLYFEINAAYGPETCHLVSELGYSDVTLRKDVTGRDRMVRAVYK